MRCIPQIMLFQEELPRAIIEANDCGECHQEEHIDLDHALQLIRQLVVSIFHVCFDLDSTVLLINELTVYLVLAVEHSDIVHLRLEPVALRQC